MNSVDAVQGWARLTAMALCVAEGIAVVGWDAPVPAIVVAVGDRFVRWHGSRPPDVGTTVARAATRATCGSSSPGRRSGEPAAPNVWLRRVLLWGRCTAHWPRAGGGA